jgi:FMN phosphatase YigB (HAD superfamily)
MPIRLVAFDIGETLVDETRFWGEWADWLGISRLTFFATLGAVIAERRQHTEVFQRLRPDLDVMTARETRGGVDWGTTLTANDLYSDALPCLRRLRANGYRLALAGNAGSTATAALRRLGVEADLFASSEEWGVAKPAAEFFARLIAEAGIPAGEIAYVGDRIDNDILPAIDAGMLGVFLRRGPWGVVQATWPEASQADRRIESLDELPDVLG